MCKEPKEKSRSTAWLEDYVLKQSGNPIDLSDRHSQAITIFALLWNLFESRFLQNVDVWTEANRGPIPKLLEESINKVYGFLKQRYKDYLGLADVKQQEQFYRILGFIRLENGIEKKDSYRKKVYQFLSTPSSLEEKKYACLMVIYRYRNNLFHGNKDLARIWNERDLVLFEVVCDFLIAYLDAYPVV